MPVCAIGVDSVAASRRGWAFRREKKVRKVGSATKQISRRTGRATGILFVTSVVELRGVIGW